MKKYNFTAKNKINHRLIVPAIAAIVLIQINHFLSDSYNVWLYPALLIFVIFFIKEAIKPSSPVIVIAEQRGNEFKFFYSFSSTPWSHVSKYRFISYEKKGKEKIRVFDKKCKLIGTIYFEYAATEVKKDFISLIKPYLLIKPTKEI